MDKYRIVIELEGSEWEVKSLQGKVGAMVGADKVTVEKVKSDS